MVNDFPQVVTIAGSDSDGSAGAQADLKTFLMSQVYGMSVLTACVAGNSYGIQASVPLPGDFIDEECRSIAADFKILACKTGMLTDQATIQTVVANLKQYDFGPLVLDPVIVTKHGAQLLDQAAFETLKQDLLPLATVVTPNFFEAQLLTGITLSDEAHFLQAAQQLQQLGAKNVLIKGSHTGKDPIVRDFTLLADGRYFWLSEPYIETTHVNGTGDTLSASICAELAKKSDVESAIRTAKKLVHQAIANGIEVGHRYGPVNHLIH